MTKSIISKTNRRVRNARPDGLNCNIHVTIITKSLFTVRRFNKKDFKLIVRFFRVLNRASRKQIFFAYCKPF